MSQYDFKPAVALVGQLADLGPTYVRSLRNDAGADKPFGIAVTRGAADNDFDELDAAGDEVIGILVHSHAFDPRDLAGANAVKDGAVANVLAFGVAFVEVEEAVTPADPVYVRFDDGVADPTKVTKGAFRKSADTATAKQLHGARWLTSAAAGGLAQVFFVAPSEAASLDAAALSTDVDALKERIHAAVADEAAIKAIAAVDRFNGMIVVDRTKDVAWIFDSGSSAGASAWVLVPDAGTGRWLRNDVSLEDLASNDNGEGASLVGIEDVGGRFTGTNTEEALQETLVDGDLRVIEATAGAEAAEKIEVACQISDVFGDDVAGAREVLIRTLAVTNDKGDIAAAGTPVGTLNKAVNPATGSNEAWMTTTAGGAFSFSVEDDAAEAVIVEIIAEGCRPRVLKLTFA